MIFASIRGIENLRTPVRLDTTIDGVTTDAVAVDPHRGLLLLQRRPGPLRPRSHLHQGKGPSHCTGYLYGGEGNYACMCVCVVTH